MASNIDPTKPQTGQASTANVRANFQAAKDEIEALQSQAGSNAANIASNTARILAAEGRLDTLEPQVSANTSQIAANASAISALDGRVSNNEANIANNTTLANSKVSKSGDTMTGPLVLPGVPTNNNEAASKQYVDNQISTVTGAPVGTVIMWPGSTLPPGWLLCDGAAIGPPYPILRGIIGNNTPDMRGQFVRGWSTDNAQDPGGPRAALSTQAEDVGPHEHEFSIPAQGGYSTEDTRGLATSAPIPIPWDSNTAQSTGQETRPKNIAMRFIIKHD